jgi:hypothetical protein
MSSPNASSGFSSEWEDAQKSRAKQLSLPTKPGPLHRRRAKANATNGKGKGRSPLVRGKGKPLMSDGREKGDDVEPDHPSDEKRKAQKVTTMKRR